jgi:hypothetical protein
MQLTIEKRVETTKEFVEVPNGFYKYGSTLFMVRENHCLFVDPETEWRDAEVRRLTPKRSSNLIALALKGEMITEQEFKAALYNEYNQQTDLLEPGLLKTA